MSDRSAIKRVFGTALTVLLIGLLFAPVAQAKDVPIYIEYTGTGHDLVPPVLGDPLPDNIVMADAKGSFGAKSTVIVVKFVFLPAPIPPLVNPCAKYAGYTYLGIIYASAVTSFNDGSQLFADVDPAGDTYMCMDMNYGTDNFGHFIGQAAGEFVGGVGRFEGAAGDYVSPFEGYNRTSSFDGQFPFRSIKGSFEGTVIFD